MDVRNECSDDERAVGDSEKDEQNTWSNKANFMIVVLALPQTIDTI